MGRSFREMVCRYAELIDLRILDLPKHYHGINTLAFDPRLGHVMIGSVNSGLGIMHSETSDIVTLEPQDENQEVTIMGMEFHPVVDTLCYYAKKSGKVCVYISPLGTCEELLRENVEINAFKLDPRGDMYTIATMDDRILVYDLHQSKMVMSYDVNPLLNDPKAPFERGDDRVFALRHSPQHPSNLYTGGWGKVIKIWDLRASRNPTGVIKGPFVLGDALDIKDDILLTGSYTKKHGLQQWDRRMGTLLSNISFQSTERDGQYIYYAHYYEDDLIVSGGSGTNSAQVIDYKANKLVDEIKMKYTVRTICIRNYELCVGGTDAYIKHKAYRSGAYLRKRFSKLV